LEKEKYLLPLLEFGLWTVAQSLYRVRHRGNLVPRILQLCTVICNRILKKVHYGPGVDSASNRNEYQEHFLVVNAAGA
jgi:hypothetical protein